MMNEFEERVARAIATELPYALHIARNGWDSVDKDSVKYASVINAARAAIAAMRQPTAAMIEAGWPHTADPCWPENVKAAWQAMIDAILTGDRPC